MTTNIIDRLCRLCFASENCSEAGGLTSIRRFKTFLCDFAGVDIQESQTIPMDICYRCESQIESVVSMRSRLSFTQSFWTMYQDHCNGIATTSREEHAIQNASMFLLSCHLCNNAFKYDDLVSHMSFEHPGHEVDCDLCKVLLNREIHLISTSTEFGEVVDDITEVLLEETVTAMDGDVDEICEEEGEEEQEEENISFCSDPSDDSADEETPAAEMDTGEGQVESYMPASYVSRSVINEEGVRERRHFCKICDKSYARTDKLRIHLRNVHDITTALESSKPFQCSTCPKSFGRLEHLRKHLGSHRGVDVVDALASYEAKEGTKAGFVCPICMKVYTRSEKLESHMLTHDETPFHCDRCDEGFSSLRTLKRHQDDCVAISMVHRCTTCNQLFTSARLLSLHQDEHADMDFICPVCGKTFGTRLLLSQHQRSKHEKAFQCPICGKQLSRQDKLDSHMKQHNGYPCKDCGDVFGSRRDWTKHRANHHHDEEGEEGSGPSPKVKRQRFQCQECPMSYATEQKLAAHMEDGHSEDGYPCPQCKIIFESKAKLKAHAYTHKGKLCGICGAVIKNSFAAHMRRHEGIKPFKCQVEGCGRDFLRNCDLTAHTKTHTGEKPFACDFPNCKMRFSRPYKVSLHRRTHTGEKPYKCEFQGCTRDFAQPFDLTLHMRRHTGEKPHQCERCKERFILGSILKKHQQNCVAVTEPQLVYMKTEIFE